MGGSKGVSRLVLVVVVCFAMADVSALAQGSSGHSVRYSGITLCADCSGIKTTLVLEKDAQDAPTSYAMTEVYVGKTVSPRKSSGTWTILRGDATDKDATVYQLHPAGSASVTSFVKTNEDELQMLDGNLGELPASLPHTLKRVSGGNAATVVSEHTSGDVNLKVGGLLEVRLEANHTTGYGWMAAPAMNAVLVRQGKAEYQENAAGGRVGGGGVEVWRFKAVKTGQQVLTFEYRRPWEKNVAASKTESFSIRVQ
jgi:copper homeostasis protein (lipoprotein)